MYNITCIIHNTVLIIKIFTVLLQDLILEEEGIVEKLSELAHHSDDDLRLNGVWALMNMAYNAESSLRDKILHHVSI